jgi:hypothetical protein
VVVFPLADSPRMTQCDDYKVIDIKPTRSRRYLSVLAFGPPKRTNIKYITLYDLSGHQCQT